MKVEEFMTEDIISVDKNVNLKYVLKLMKKNNVTKLPVLEDKKLVGMVTDNIIAYKLGSIRKKGVPPSRLHASSVLDKDVDCIKKDTEIKDILKKVGKPGPTMLCITENRDLLGVITKADLLPLVKSKKQVRTIMRKKVITVSPDDRVIHARRIMIDEDIARIPVVNEGILIGVISDTEIAYALAKLKRLYSIGKQKHRLEILLVKDVMKKPVITINPNKTIKDAAELMMENEIGFLPILQNDKLIGIVSRTDLLKTISR